MLATVSVMQEWNVSRAGDPLYEPSEFREWAGAIMRRRGWNQAELAKYVGIAPSNFSRWLRGQQPSPRWVRVMADRLGHDEDDLLRMTGHRQGARPIEDESPDYAELIAKIRLIALSEERKEILETLLDAMRERDQRDD